MSFFISNAYAAADAAQANPNESFFSLILIAVIFILFYIMLIRPQNKRAKEQREMIGRLKKGDEIITSGGILGKVVSLDDNYVRISAAEGVEFHMQKGAISSILPKGTLKTL